MVNCCSRNSLTLRSEEYNLPSQQTENQLRQHGHHLISKHQSLLLSQISLVVQVAVTYTSQA